MNDPQRGGLHCQHEAFCEACNQGERPLWPRVKECSLAIPGLSLESVLDNLQTGMHEKQVFIKDFPHDVEHMCDEKFLNLINHSFSIRDPAKTITSIYDTWPDFHEKEIGFVEQRQLFDRLCDQLGDTPPVTDSDELLESPDRMLEQYCRAGCPTVRPAPRLPYWLH